MTRYTAAPALIVIICFLFAACSSKTLNLPPGDDAIEKIQAGMNVAKVREIAGDPDLEKPGPFGATVLYYRESIVDDCTKDISGCIPIVVENGTVAAIGDQWMAAWRNEKSTAAAKKKRAPKPIAPEPVEPVIVEAPKTPPKKPAPPNMDAETQAQIARLEKEVRRIPVSRTMDNLKIYRYLRKLDPANPRYKRKVAFYEAQLADDRKRLAEARRKEAEKRRRQNIELKEFKGNEQVRMALENLGNGKFHIWIENTSSDPLEVTPKQFTLICTNNARFAVYQTKDFNEAAAPGTVIDGRLTFDAYCPPKVMVFSHPVGGRLSRAFPEILPAAPETPPKKSQ
jgi:hypothetical protein